MQNPVQTSGADVLRAFHGDAPYLFLGAAFVAVGLVSVAFAIMRRKRDMLLVDFALFAIFYGARLWVQSGLLAMAIHGSVFFSRLRSAIDYVILIPAFLFFNALGTPSRVDRVVGYLVCVTGVTLTVLTFAFGYVDAYRWINSVVVIVALSLYMFRFSTSSPRNRDDADYAVIRWGLLFFVAFAVRDNVAGMLKLSALRTEPYAFVILLASLGYVAARRTLQRDRQLNEIQTELEVASNIQQSILPAAFPESAQFRVAARYVPVRSVAGDFYDYIVTEDGQVGLLIADVSGHGVPAALIASMVKLAAASQRSVASDPSRLLAGMNTTLYGNTQDQFVTAAYVHLDSKARRIRYSAAGHPPMFLLRNGRVMKVEENGLLLAAFALADYSNATHPLEPKDRLLLYTDGVVEASNAAGHAFGDDALSACLAKTSDMSCTDAADLIVKAVQKWQARQTDDLTVLVCDYLGDPEIREASAI